MRLHHASLLLLPGGGAAVPSSRDRRPKSKVHGARRRLEEPYYAPDPSPFERAGGSIKFLGCRNLFDEASSSSFGVAIEEFAVLEAPPRAPPIAGTAPPVGDAGDPFGGRGGRRGRRRLDQSEPAPRAIVSFRFCPSDVPFVDVCGAACDRSDGEVMTVDMETYLDIVMDSKRNERDEMCELCGECLPWLPQLLETVEGEDSMPPPPGEEEIEDEGDMPEVCIGLAPFCQYGCETVENMEENGYVDASEFAECRELGPAEDAEGGDALYAGAMCDESGSRIRIGVFADEECTVREPSRLPDDFITDEEGHGMKLSYYLINQAFGGDGYCVATCANNEGHDVDDSIVPDADEVCTELLEAYRREDLDFRPAIVLPPELPIMPIPISFDPWEPSKVCHNETGHYAGKDCRYPATSICGSSQDDDVEAEEEEPMFCVNNGTCVELPNPFEELLGQLDDDWLEDALGDDDDMADDNAGGFLFGNEDDHLGVLLNSFSQVHCECPTGYSGKHCENDYDFEPPPEIWDVWDNDYESLYSDVNYTVREREALLEFYAATQAQGDHWAEEDGWSSDANVCEWHGMTCDEAGSVTRLELGSNSIKGILEWTSLTRLRNLTWLDLSNNEFFGTMSFDNGRGRATPFEKLTHLDLGNNDLRGSVPWSLSMLSNLETLDLRGNDFTGFPFHDFAYSPLRALRKVDISSNEITGTLPFRLFSGNPNLRYLDMSRNRLSGTIPAVIMKEAFVDEQESDKPDAFLLDLSFNRFDGTVPDLGVENLDINVVGNRFTDIESSACGRDWNDGATSRFGCDGIACPVGTSNSEGRQISGDNPCANCNFAEFLGTVECTDGASEEEEVRADQDPFDLEEYDVKFVSCRNLFEEEQEVSVFEGEAASVVTFRFCPANVDKVGCQGTCDFSEHEEMTLDMRTYVRLVSNLNNDVRQVRCDHCLMCAEMIEGMADDSFGDDDFIIGLMEKGDLQKFQEVVTEKVCSEDMDTSTCVTDCQEAENRNVLDAMMYGQCQFVTSEDGVVYYAGHTCSDDGSQIKIGVFTDEYCTVRDLSKEFDQIMDLEGQGISYQSLDQTFASDGECVATCDNKEYDLVAELAEMDLPDYLMPESVPSVNLACTELYEAYWREGYSIKSDATTGVLQDNSGAISNPSPSGSVGVGSVGGVDGGSGSTDGGPQYGTTSNYTFSPDATTGILSQVPSSQPSSMSFAETPQPTESPTEFVDSLVSDTSAGCEAFHSWLKSLILLIPAVCCMTLMLV